MSADLRQVACPIALHPDGAPRRIAVFQHPQAGWQLVKGGLRAGEAPAAGAARELFEESGLETRAAISIGEASDIQEGAIWHFALCRIAPPVRARWQHFCADDAGHLFTFEWMSLDDAPSHTFDPIYLRALDWIKGRL